jgi:hypothetical protein
MRGCPAKSYKFDDPLLQPISSISPRASATSRLSGKFRKTENKLFREKAPLKSGSLRGCQEVHHEMVSAVIHEK